MITEEKADNDISGRCFSSRVAAAAAKKKKKKMLFQISRVQLADVHFAATTLLWQLQKRETAL